MLFLALSASIWALMLLRFHELCVSLRNRFRSLSLGRILRYVIMVYKYDYLVIGSGIAGMSFALKVAHSGKVALVCKTSLDEANTYFAQGGVASVTNTLVDNFDKHIHDTMVAGDWLSDPVAVEKVVREAPGQIQALIDWGVDFDKKENGEFDLHR